MIHMAGFNRAPAFNTDYLLGPAWFISSLLLALIPFYFLCIRYGKTFAGLSAGAFASYLSGFYKKLPNLKGGNTFLWMIDIFSWIAAVSLFVFPKDVIPDSDMVFWLIPFSFILLNGNNNFGPISQWLNYHGCTLWTKLGKLSDYIYLLHFQVIMICKQLIGIDHSIAGSLLILSVALAFAAVVKTIRETIRYSREYK